MRERGGADLGGVRRRNLSRLLELVHREGPLPRAVLTERTGLNRSTVADLVRDLERAGLVLQTEPDPSRRVGRPSPRVRARDDVVAITANPEVDALTIAVIGLDRGVQRRVRIRFDRPPTPDAAMRALVAQFDAWRFAELRGARVVGFGLAIPGLVNVSEGVVRDAPHLSWREAPVGDLLQTATGLSVAVSNDATLGMQAEHLYGAAQGVEDVIYLNGGASGIGGGLVVGGSTVQGAGGYAGEFGQNRPGMIHAADQRVRDGVLEDEVNRARLLAAVGVRDADDVELTAALSAARGPAADEVARQRRILATALANAVNVLNPSLVVLGGFLAALAEVDLDGLREAVSRQAMAACGEGLEIRPAALGENRLLIGAAELVFASLIEDPVGRAPREAP